MCCDLLQLYCPANQWSTCTADQWKHTAQLLLITSPQKKHLQEHQKQRMFCTQSTYNRLDMPGGKYNENYRHQHRCYSKHVPMLYLQRLCCCRAVMKHTLP
jgi:hypothetical protein